MAAIEAGVKIIGENYVQEALAAFQVIGQRGQRVFYRSSSEKQDKKGSGDFDIIETVDSVELAEEINKRAVARGKVMPVLLEVNSGRESQKFGVFWKKWKNFWPIDCRAV